MKLSDRLARPVPAGSAPPPPPAAAAPAPPPPPVRAAAPRTSSAARRGEDWSDKKRRIHDHLVAELGPHLARSDGDLDLDHEIRARLDDALAATGVEATSAQRRTLLSEVTADILGYGPLEPLLTDPTITEVMVNGYDEVYIERAGLITRTDARFDDEKHLRQVIDRIVGAVGRRVDESSPVCDARLPDGSRVNVILPPLSLRGPAVTIRKFPESPYAMDDLVRLGTATPELAQFLEAAVRGKLNVLVSGGTGSGKTTMLNAVSQFIPANERVITIEDAAELQLHQPHVLPLESRPPNTEGVGAVSIRDLVRNALRMRPDRILVGEVRGPEALDMLQAMNTGHEGSLTTVHANSPRDALSRIETMVLMSGVDLGLRAVRDQIGSALDLLIQLDRLGDGRRVVSQVSEIQGLEGDVITVQDLFVYEFSAGGRETTTSEGRLAATGLRPRCLDKLRRAGMTLPPALFAPALPEVGRRR